MSTTIITGGLGFTGRHLVKRLINDDGPLVLLVRNVKTDWPRLDPTQEVLLLDLESLVAYVEANPIGTVINLAGSYNFNPTINELDMLIQSNFSFPMVLAELVARAGHKPTWIQASSFMQDFEGIRHQPICFYAACKDSIETGLNYFRFAHEFEVVNLVLPHIFGDNDPRPKVIPYLLHAARTGSQATISSGNQLLDLVHVEDVVNAILASRKLNSGRWSVTSGEYVTLSSIVSYLADIAADGFQVLYRSESDRKFDTYQPWPPHEIVPDWFKEKELWQWLKLQLN